jgi:hypothetical protein
MDSLLRAQSHPPVLLYNPKFGLLNYIISRILGISVYEKSKTINHIFPQSIPLFSEEQITTI